MPNTKRLLKLAELLRKEAKEGDIHNNNINFNLTTWGILNCQTVACAIGLATLSDEFPELKPSKPTDDGYFYPKYKRSSSWTAVTRYFDINYEHAQALFDSDSYKEYQGKEAAYAVARRITHFVKNKKWQNKKRADRIIARSLDW